jgi:hypothetical protein
MTSPIELIPEWALIENAVTAIQRALGRPGNWTVTPNVMVLERISQNRRQVDVFAECPSGPSTFRVAIDVKHESSPLDIVAVEQLCAKGKKLDIDRYVIIATSGFAEPAKEEARRQGVLVGSLEKISDTVFFNSAQSTRPIITVQRLDFVFDDEVKKPPLSALGRAWLEEDRACTHIGHVAFLWARESLKQVPPRPEDETHVITVEDTISRWKALHIDGQPWSPPRELHISWTVRHDPIRGVALRTDDGREVLTMITEIDGEYRQVTFIQNSTPVETALHGSTIAVTTSVLRPPRTEV